jgi:hypothetical protein
MGLFKRSKLALLSQTSRTRRLMRLLSLPMLLLAGAPLLVTELRRPLFHNALASAIADVIYLGHGAFGLAHGHIPYTSGFMTYPDQHITYLYPPLSLLITMPPVLAGPYFTAAFSIEMLVLVLAGALILGRVCRGLGMTPYVGLAVAVTLLAAGPVLLTRVDAVQGLLVAGAALALTRRRAMTAVLLVSLAVLVKETAITAAVPVVLWCLLPEPGQTVEVWKRVGKVIAGALPALAIFTFFLVWSRGAELTAALSSVHRGLEIESVPASVAILLGRLVPVHAYLGHLASWQLRAADAGLLASASTAVGVVAVIGGALFFTWSRRRPVTAVAFCVAAGLCATPVLSPQYLLLLFPVLVLAAAAEFPTRQAHRLLLLGLAVALLTQAEFPYLYGSVVSLGVAGSGSVLARNALLIVIAVLLARHGEEGRAPVAEGVPLPAGLT